MSRKIMRNPVQRKEFENPAGNVMQELAEADLDKTTGGIIDYNSHWYSCGYICTITGECQGSKVFVCCN